MKQLYTNLTPIDKKEIETMNFLNDHYIPALRGIIKRANPQLFKQWHENCCMQAAVFSKTILDIVLPRYKWQIKYLLFQRKDTEGLFNHAFVIGQCKKTKRTILVDLERYPENPNVFAVIQDINKPYKNIETYDNQRIVEEISVITNSDYKSMMFKEREFFTGLQGKELVEKILATICGINLLTGNIGIVEFASNCLDAVQGLSE